MPWLWVEHVLPRWSGLFRQALLAMHTNTFSCFPCGSMITLTEVSLILGIFPTPPTSCCPGHDMVMELRQPSWVRSWEPEESQSNNMEGTWVIMKLWNSPRTSCPRFFKRWTSTSSYRTCHRVINITTVGHLQWNTVLHNKVSQVYRS